MVTEASSGASGEAEGPLLDLVLELRKALREAKRFDLGDTAQGATWTRR